MRFLRDLGRFILVSVLLRFFIEAHTRLAEVLSVLMESGFLLFNIFHKYCSFLEAVVGKLHCCVFACLNNKVAGTLTQIINLVPPYSMTLTSTYRQSKLYLFPFSDKG